MCLEKNVLGFLNLIASTLGHKLNNHILNVTSNLFFSF